MYKLETSGGFVNVLLETPFRREGIKILGPVPPSEDLVLLVDRANAANLLRDALAVLLPYMDDLAWNPEDDIDFHAGDHCSEQVLAEVTEIANIQEHARRAMSAARVILGPMTASHKTLDLVLTHIAPLVLEDDALLPQKTFLRTIASRIRNTIGPYVIT